MPPFKRKYTAKPTVFVYSGAKYLVIVESPSKCQKIESYLGNAYQCIASKGHIREIEGLKSIDSKHNFDIEFSIISEKKAHVSAMKSIMKQYAPENILLATDDDREGEAIAWHICCVFGLPVETTKRILFREITPAAIQYAVQHPTIINMSLVYAQHCRQALDMIVGYKISPLLWRHIHNNKSEGLSAGRCQTPALRLVYDNEKQQTSSVELKYKVKASFFSSNVMFDLNTDFADTETLETFLQKSKSYPHKLSICATKPSTQSAPKPFNTSRLLQSASNMLHYSPKTTMELCQKLYQDGYITYMRTDSTTYSTAFLQTVSTQILRMFGKEEYIGNIGKLEHKNSQHPHEAIRCTNIAVSFINDDNKQACTLYAFIWKNTMQSCMSNATFQITPLHITAPLDHKYIHNVEVPIFLGWKALDNQSAASHTPNGDILLYASSVSKSSSDVKYNYIQTAVSAHSGRAHYTEAGLIQTLEEKGIGRPSTFASLVETIQDRGYVRKQNVEGTTMECYEYTLSGDGILAKQRVSKTFGAEHNKLVIQPIGIATLEFLLEHFETLFSYGYTEQMENELDVIAQQAPEISKTNWYQPCKTCADSIKGLLKTLRNIQKKEYKVDENHVVVFTNHGAALKCVSENGDATYKSIKQDIKLDLEKLERGEYTLNELLEVETEDLGIFENEPVKLKTGKYGAYVVWNGANISLKGVHIPLNQIRLDHVIPFLVKHTLEKNPNADLDAISSTYSSAYASVSSGTVGNSPKSMARPLSACMSIRKKMLRGKPNYYVFHQTPQMAKPAFYSLTKFKQDPIHCDKEALISWITETYNITP